MLTNLQPSKLPTGLNCERPRLTQGDAHLSDMDIEVLGWLQGVSVRHQYSVSPGDLLSSTVFMFGLWSCLDRPRSGFSKLNTTSSDHWVLPLPLRFKLFFGLSFTLHPTSVCFLLRCSIWPTTDSHLIYFSFMSFSIFAIHKFQPRLFIVRFLAYRRIRAAISQNQVHITSDIGHPWLYNWVIWYVVHYFFLFLDLDGSLSRNLHKSPTGSWKARHCCHWMVQAFQGGHL